MNTFAFCINVKSTAATAELLCCNITLNQMSENCMKKPTKSSYTRVWFERKTT